MGTEKRRVIAAAFIIFLIFLVDGHALWLCYFIPIYCAAVRVSKEHQEVTPA
jgi:hypothetical protein